MNEEKENTPAVSVGGVEKRAEKIYPTESEIASRIGSLQAHIAEIDAGEVSYSQQKVTAADRLALVKPELKKLRLEHNLPYRVIAQILEKHLGLTVNETTIRDFCTNVLGIPKKRDRKVSKTEAEQEAKNFEDRIQKQAEYNAAAEVVDEPKLEPKPASELVSSEDLTAKYFANVGNAAHVLQKDRQQNLSAFSEDPI